MSFIEFVKSVQTVADLQAYLQENTVNPHSINRRGENAFVTACHYNRNPDILRYLINTLKIDRHRTTEVGNNGLLLACKDNPSLDVVKCIVEEFGLSTYAVNNVNVNALLIAAMRNPNPEIVEYLVKEQEMFINYQNDTGQSPLYLACMRNSNPKMLEKIIELGGDEDVVDLDGYNSFMVFCRFNTSLDMADYICKHTNINLYAVNRGMTGLSIAGMKNNKKVIEYLVDNTDLVIRQLLEDSISGNIIHVVSSMRHPYRYIWQPDFTNRRKLEVYEKLIENGHPKYISHEHVRLENLDNLTYDEVVKLKPHITYDIPCEKKEDFQIWDKPYFSDALPNFLEDDDKELLFVCHFGEDTIKFYGDKIIVFNIIPIFKKMVKSGMKDSEGLHLTLDIHPKIFELYLRMCYTGNIDVSKLDSVEILQLAKIIDMYPNELVGVECLEGYLCDFINGETRDFLEYLCEGYQLRYVKMKL